MTLWHIVMEGGPLMWPLLLCSLVVLTLIIERGLFWFGLSRQRDNQVLDEMLRLAEDSNWQEIRNKTKNCRDYVVKVLITGIVHREFSMTKAMEAETEVTLQQMRRSMAALDTMITVAPLLGILGTVLGIIASFEVLGSGGISDPRAVTGGIAQALVTTAAGLTIAITAVIPYNFFNSLIERATHKIEKYATSLEVVYERNEKEAMGHSA